MQNVVISGNEDTYTDTIFLIVLSCFMVTTTVMLAYLAMQMELKERLWLCRKSIKYSVTWPVRTSDYSMFEPHVSRVCK